MSEPVDPREQFGEHGEWDALAVGWALSALDPEDEDRFADHLPGCARCTATVRESLYTVADLAYALPDEAPPPALKSRLMAAVAAEPRGAGQPAAGLPAAAPVAQPEEAAEPEDWPLGEPHPGTPGYGIDWFAKPARPPEDPGGDPGEWGIHQPPVGERPSAQPAGSGVDGPTVEVRRPGWLDQPADREPDSTGIGPHTGNQTGDGTPAGTGAGTGTGRGVEPDPRPPAGAGYRGEDLSRDAGPGQVDGADVVALSAGRRRLGRRIGVGVAAAAVLALIAGLLVSNVRLRSEQDDLRRLVAQREAAIQQLTANGPARVAALTADGQPSPQRRATLVVRGDRIEIIVETLGATTGDETYWLWTLRCDTPQPTDLKPIRWFTVAQSEFSVRDIGSDPGVASAPCYAISSELGTATPKAPRQVVAVGQPE